MFDKGGEWANAVEAGGRLYIYRVSLISVVIEDLFFQSIGGSSEAIP